MSEEYLIRNTTREERERIVNEALGVTDGLCDGCAPGILKMYDDYIEGRMELAEVNAAFHAGYVVEHDRGPHLRNQTEQEDNDKGPATSVTGPLPVNKVKNRDYSTNLGKSMDCGTFVTNV